MNISKLIALGRLEPIVKSDSGSPTWLSIVGYKRRPRSRKHWQEFMLKKPRPYSMPNNATAGDAS